VTVADVLSRLKGRFILSLNDVRPSTAFVASNANCQPLDLERLRRQVETRTGTAPKGGRYCQVPNLLALFFVNFGH
jgi:hypothetical protein